MSVICELLLSLACLWACLISWRDRQHWQAVGFGLIAATALGGALLFAGLESVKPGHQLMSGISGRIALLLIAVGRLQGIQRQVLLMMIAALMLWLPQPWPLAGNLLALIAIAWPGRSQHWPPAIAGALLFMFAGLVVGSQGQWLGIARQDIYHLTLMLAALCWGAARLNGKRSPTPASAAMGR